MVKKFISVFAIIMILFAYTNMSVNAATQSDVDKLNQQKKDAQNQLENVKDKKEAASDELENIKIQVSSLQNEISALESKLATLNSKIAEKENEITNKQEVLKEKEELLKKRLVTLYKGGGISYLDVLLGSNNYIEMLSKFSAVNRIAEKDTDLINQVSTQKTEIENQKKELESDKTEVEASKKEKDAKNAQLQAAQVAKQSAINNLSAEEKELQSTISKFETEINKAQEEIRRATQNVISSGGGYTGSFTGVLAWPVSNNYNIITSTFGPRTAPTAGASSNHGAVDIGVSYVPVYAPAAGKVILASYVSGYGNYIMIDHGNGYYTAFGHLSAYKVSTGTVVSQGQQIAVSGNTGVSTGPHLHYEVYKGGRVKANRVDPLAYTSHPPLVYR